jgi:hypothetical protein
MQSGKREFKLLGAKGEVLGTYTGSCPYQAAMKAATRGHQSIMLCEHYGNAKYACKMHVYEGSLRSLEHSEKTPFAQKHNIKYKPDVTKIGMMRRSLRTSDNDYAQSIKDQEKKCDKIDPEDAAEQCVSPCAVHPTSGLCYYPEDDD